MHSSRFTRLRSGRLLFAPLACLATPLFAQVIIHPELIFTYASLPAPREAAPDDPAMEPIVSLATLVMTLGDGLGSGAITLEPKAALAVELQLSALIDKPVLSRADANRHASDLAALLEPRQLMALASLGQERNYAGHPALLGAEAATANIFYDPGSLPGYGARFILAHLGAILRPTATGATDAADDSK